MAIDFANLFQELRSNVTTLAANTVKDYAVAATVDGEQILNQLKEQLQLWIKQIEEGKLSKEDFEYNILSGKDLMTMVSLKQKGLALIEIDRFRNSVYKIITETIRNVIP
ncbi:hypothetical protein EON73_03025 [bacterium]|nr:MAG: hypothetical protein EON73_03025 [bacterium]